ncbi:MAG: peptidase domain-containing ABC transporter [Pseudomonadota bacterium]
MSKHDSTSGDLEARLDADAPDHATGETVAEQTSGSAEREPAEETPAKSVGVRRLVFRAAAGMLPQLLALSLFINALALAVPVFVLQVYDRVVPHSSIATLQALLIGVLIAIAFDFILKQARSRVVQMVALRVDAQLSKRLFARLAGLPLSRLEARSDAEWRMLLRDAEAVRDVVAGPTVVLAIDLPFAALLIAVIAFVAPPLAGLLLIWAPIYLGVALLSSFLVARAAEKEQRATRDQSGLVNELVSGRGVAQALGLGAPLLRRWEAGQAENMRLSIGRGAQVDTFSNLAGSMAILTSVTLTTAGAVAIVGLEMTMGGLIAANMLAARVVQPLSQIVGLWRGVARFREAAERLDPVLAEACEPRRGAVARSRPTGALKLDGAVYSYPGAPSPALNRMTIAFQQGTMTGIVGENGCGKTTMLKALQGLYPLEEGRALLDGEDIAQFGRDELAAWIGYAPQEPFLFEGNVRDNIARGRDSVSDEAVRLAAELAGADAFITADPDGYGAEVGEGGRRFSPGLRQRIALARALVSDPAALLLDEPSANLDLAAEAALIARLRELKESRAVVVVSHSLPVLQACDQIVVIHGGRVAMKGRAAELLPQLSAPKAAPRSAPPRSAPAAAQPSPPAPPKRIAQS